VRTIEILRKLACLGRICEEIKREDGWGLGSQKKTCIYDHLASCVFVE